MHSRITNRILEHAREAAQTDQQIVVVGEYGSGKSWLAKRIHKSSNRAEGPFKKLNCYTLEPGEAKKKIFGYLQFIENGVKIHKGYFEKTDGGTLLLEGFDAFSEHLQEQILSAAMKNKTHHVGSSKEIPVDVRIILSFDIESHHHAQFKFNLLKNTLNIDPYTLNYPPLRQRREEICEMVDDFLKSELANQYDFIATEISAEALYMCIRYDWPGNVQQLKNAIEHASIISTNGEIRAAHLPISVKEGQPAEEELQQMEHTYTYRMAEKELIRKVLEKSASAEDSIDKLGICREAFEEKLDEYQFESELIYNANN